jgi:hypothetical protein
MSVHGVRTDLVLTCADFRKCPWLCENAKTLNHDRRSCSSKTVLVAQRASGFNLVIELKNIILRRVSIFEFSHSQVPKQTSCPAAEFREGRPLKPAASERSARAKHVRYLAVFKYENPGWVLASAYRDRTNTHAWSRSKAKLADVTDDRSRYLWIAVYAHVDSGCDAGGYELAIVRRNSIHTGPRIHGVLKASSQKEHR